MPRQSNSTYQAPANTAAVPSTKIGSAAFNTLEADIGNEITNSLDRLGRGPMQAALPMGGFRATNQGAGILTNDGATVNQAQSGVLSQAAAVSGVDTIVLTFSPTFPALVVGMKIKWISAGLNLTTTPTLNPDTLGAITILRNGGTAIVAGDTGAVGYECEAIYNGTNWLLMNPAAFVVSLGANNAFTGNNTHSGTEIFTNSAIFNSKIIVASGPICTPGGRLTLTSGVPVLTSDVTAAVIVYYTPYQHNFAMLYNGTSWETNGFVELSQALSDSTKSPAASAASTAYDMFLWNDAGTLRCTRGPGWSVGGGSLTARGTGAGSTALSRTNGALTNQFDITNGPLAGRGLYVGSIVTNASNQVDWVANPAAAGGGNARIGLWNMYNRVSVQASNIDTSSGWTASGHTTFDWRAADASNSNRVTIFTGLVEDTVTAFGGLSASNVNGGTAGAAIGVDSVTTPSGPAFFSAATNIYLPAAYSGQLKLGTHFYQLMEWATNGAVFTGSSGTTSSQTVQMIAQWRA